MSDSAPTTSLRDVFVSYGHADADWVRTLAENLHQSGLDVAFDEWEISPGDVLIHKLDEMLLSSRDGILVVSPASMRSPYVRKEYAALMQRSIERGRRLIPVLLQDAELPPLLATETWVDFRNVDGPDYLARVGELVRALKGERKGPPRRTGELSLPPGSGYTAVGVSACRLSISESRTQLTASGTDISGAPPSPRFDFDDLQWRLERARAHRGALRKTDDAQPGPGALDEVLRDFGDALTAAFLPEEVVTALAKAIADTGRLNGSLQVALDVAETFADLPWETLRLPDSGPLALAHGVEVYRKVDTGGTAPALAIPGPLRILVAIGSPETQNARGELLDMEAELQRILDATETARNEHKVFVHILERGSVAAIHDALATRRFHVLHISAHAGPGTLLLETDNGREDRVSAERLWEEGIPLQRAVPLVVLAGCSTGLDVISDKDDTKLPGLARALVSHGVPSVIAMQAPVGDVYATELMGSVYESLSAPGGESHPLAALSEARQTRERARLADTSQPLPPEWATPAFFASGGPLRLYDPTGPAEDLKEPAASVFDPGVVVRRIGDLVGRRREQRVVLRDLRQPDGAGVLIHGIGGVGKSTLSAQVLHRLSIDDRFVLVSLKGETDPDRIFDALGSRLFSLAGLDERDPLRQHAAIVRERKYPWRDRLDYLATNLLSQMPIAFLFDNFEDNVRDGRVHGEHLAALLARWLEAPGRSRLVFTCRYPFLLPDDAQERLASLHLGPLSWPETRKLFLRLEGLRALTLDDQRKAYEQVGGHPRALEYLDAILRDGTAQFSDVTIRLKQQLRRKGITDAAQWCADTAGGLNAALAETVTLAADDVLLDQLLGQLEGDALARRLLIGAAVYRQPVDVLGLIWVVGEAIEHAPDTARSARLEAMLGKLQEARKTNPVADWNDVLSPAEGEQYNRDFAEEHRPPVAVPPAFATARQRLLDLSLLAPVRLADGGEDQFLVHRWTAAALAKRAKGDEQARAHRAAADYWRWRVQARPQSPEQDVADLQETRYHLHAVDDLAGVSALTEQICSQLHTWGAWEAEERLLHEHLAYVPTQSDAAASALQRLGLVAQERGDYNVALDWYRKGLAISDQLGNRARLASSYHQLGNVTYLRGDYDAALDWYRKGLALNELLDNRSGMATSYHQLGMVAQERGDYDAALDWYRKSLRIDEQLGNRAGMASSYHQLGIVSQIRSDYDAALNWYRRSVQIQEQLGNRAGMANSYHQLGMVAQDRRDYDAALDWYRKSLRIDEQLGNRAGMANTYHQLGMVAQDRRDYDAALDWYRKSLAINEQLGNRAGIATSYGQLGIAAQQRGEYDVALDWLRKSLAINQQLGNRADMANSISQIGVLYTSTGRAANAVSHNLRSLAIRLELHVPQRRVDLHWLSRQRQMLGAEAFKAIVAEHADAEIVTAVLSLLDEFERQEPGQATG